MRQRKGRKKRWQPESKRIILPHNKVEIIKEIKNGLRGFVICTVDIINAWEGRDKYDVV